MKSDTENGKRLLGLDVGTSRIVLARQEGSGVDCRSQLNEFVAVPYSRMTEKAMRKQNVPFSRSNGELVVYGTEAQRFATLLNVETRRPMTQGTMNAAEEEGLAVVRGIVRALVGDFASGKPRVFFSIPAPPLKGGETLAFHEAALRQMLAEMGAEPTSINEGLAVVYAELEETNYTGIGISCGGGLCNVCLSWLSMPVIAFSVPKAGDFIDAGAAAVTGELATRIRLMKEESFHFNGHFSGKIQQALAVYYDDVIQTLVEAIREGLAGGSRIPKQGRPIPVVLSGGTACPAGFAKRFESALKSAELPIEISEVRVAGEPLTATARGALIAAMAEAE